ncbi:hypothetical protein [Rhodococcoides fascians]|uniref:hypothetical protein n=1 Tax=Rhodococcoides fascians TaxID=1828 RepID=UPI00366D19B8
MDDQTQTAVTCIAGDHTCAGPVEYRIPLSGSGRAFARCDTHWSERLDLEEDVNRRYPVIAPADFDSSYAGESWYED